MAAEKLEKEVIDVFKIIDEKKNFVLSGGAGSGKTYSLVSVINEIYSRNPVAKIACITYTNAAVHEIENRVANDNLRISTIHDFLWNNIASFQKELKSTLIEGINNSEVKYKNIKVETPYSNTFEGGIKYTEYLRLSTGNISHDEIITLANQMFKKYPKLCDVLNNKYDYILVDEYQDTFPEVVEILLDFLPNSKTTTKGIIGFFGDSMQSIYDDSIGDLNKYIESSLIVEIQKKQNRRNPQSVITLSNKLRTDGLKQEPSKDGKAPNMENGVIKQGSIKFLYGDIVLGELKRKEYFNGWNFDNPKETKELRLTHNLIAATAGFSRLMKIYDKDPLLKLKGDFLAYIKEKGIKINEDQTFDAVLRSIEWKFSNRVRTVENRGRQQIEVFLENKENSILYDIIKNKAFSDVKKIYFDKDNLISDKKEIDEETSTQSKRDKLIRHLFKIQSVIKSYEDKDYNEFLNKTSFKIRNIADKKNIRKKVNTLVNMKENTIAEVISYADESGLCLKDDNINRFITENDYLFKRVSEVNYDEFIHLYDYLEGFSPLSTQHKIKGSEFNNVLIILDNGKWNDYNFEYLFNPNHQRCNENVLDRTKKLFYVCCTRAMENLVVYCENPSRDMINTAEAWFGKGNCIQL